MHILLVNANPVVSRLLVLCTRDVTVVLDEVTTTKDVKSNAYDIVFVDEALFGQEVADLLTGLGNIKKVFISYRSESMKDFDITIKKPFLPSQIIDIIKETETKEIDSPKEEEKLVIDSDKKEEEIPSIFPLSAEDDMEEILAIDESSATPTVLDSNEIEKIKALLDMDDNLEVIDEVLSDDEIEARKIALIKEQLIADGLEIVEEDKIVEELSVNLDGTLKKSKKEKVRKRKQKKEKKSKKLKFTEENMEHIEDAIEMAMAMMTKKQMKKLLKGKEIAIRIKLEDKN